jgi:hypothetical protein
MNIIELYRDFNVPHATEGHKHCRPGWVNVECPFCTGNPGLHLGYNLASGGFVCWRCGWHPPILTISKLIHISEPEAKALIKLYGGIVSSAKFTPITKIKGKDHQLPSNTSPLQSNHRHYLEGRGFDPDKLIKEWNLLGTGPISLLSTGKGKDKKEINFKHRIIAPIIWDGIEVSFQGRDITDKASLKYITCPKDRELIFHKHILYGKQEYWKESVILVEGITDVWRFGRYSMACFGIKFTPVQVREIAKRFRTVAVCFDGGELQAISQSNKIVAELRFRGVDAFRVDIEGDPGEMKQEEADYLVNQLIKT